MTPTLSAQTPPATSAAQLTATGTPTHSPPASPAPESAAQAWLARMTLEQKIGQVLVIGFDGHEASPELLEMVTKYHIGGVILFARNVRSPLQIARLTNTLQQAAIESGHPGLLIAIDQEGGRVARLTEDKGFTEFPGAMAIAAASPRAADGTPDPATARAVYVAIAEELRAVGINTNFAPDLDVNNNPHNPVIGLRSFGSTPGDVAVLGAAVIAGLQENGVLAFGKHFPGHGDTALDSHSALPVIPHERARLEQVEFAPFRAGMQAQVAGMMSAHVVFPAIEPQPGLPGTLSPAVMTHLLREEMGYTGLLATDSLEMGALGEAGYPVPLAAATALQAGADVLLFNRDHTLHRQAYELIQAWVESGQVPPARLDEAVRRMLEAKQRFNLLNPVGVNEQAIDTLMNASEHHTLSRAVAERSITLLRDQRGLLPLERGAPYLLVELPGAEGLGRLLRVETLTLRTEPSPAEVQRVIDRARKLNVRAVLVASVDANRSERQAALVQALLDHSLPVMAIATRNPYDILAYPEVDAYLVSYGTNPPALEALAAVLTGQAPALGRLPVDIPGLFAVGDGQ